MGLRLTRVHFFIFFYKLAKLAEAHEKSHYGIVETAVQKDTI